TGRQFVLGHADCWSLIMDYFRTEHGIKLPNYSVDRHWWEQGENLYMDNWYECGFREFDGPSQPGDMVIMQVQSTVPNHAGILLEGNVLLHHMYGQLSQRIPYGGYYRDRTIKILRYKDLM
ncbi:NlpC/P60 family protein, partial [Enterobacter kobei]